MTFLRGFVLLAPFACAAWAQDAAAPLPTAADSLPAFRQDSTKAALIQALEAGKKPAAPQAPMASAASAESLDAELHQRHIFIGGTFSVAFANLSAQSLFANHMNIVEAQDTLTHLQSPDTVAIYFPVGFMVGFPVLPYADFWLRTESFWYSQSGLAEDAGRHTHQFRYALQGDLIGAGVRYLIPVSLFSVNGHPGLYTAYTQFWNFGPTGIYNSNGSARAKMEPWGAGYEIQAGFQQSFDKRWTWTGGLAFTNFSFKSNTSWRALLPDAPDEPAAWTLRSLRLCLQGFYQFGIRAQTEKAAKK